ncbi:PIN domain-containing protein [Lysinibacillus capsici]|uniref:PIN domain-containing protein n=1 Tax=Lysinibacillus capsici TaxID=2115968 RepID=UPI0034E394FA
MSFSVFIDTNIIYNDYFFKSANLKKLLKLSKVGLINLYITKFNYNEIIKKYTENIRIPLKQIRNTKHDLTKLGLDNIANFDNLKVRNHVDAYIDILGDIISNHNMQIVDYPVGSSTIQKISDKYFNNKKPFDENKVSFQDAIIWESIVEFYSNESPDVIIFISNNYKDFADNTKTSIHEALAADIPDIKYYQNLDTFFDNEIDNITDYFTDNPIIEEEEILESLEFHLDNSDQLIVSISDMLMNSEFDGEYFSGWGTDPYIESTNIEIFEVTLDVEENSLLLDFSVELEVSFDIEMVDPTYENGDSGNGMVYEHSSTDILIHSNITYDLVEEKFVDYIELDRGFN